MQIALNNPAATPHPFVARTAYGGQERRRAAPPPLSRWCRQMLDEVEYGVMLLDEQARVLHANFTARSELDDTHPLHCRNGRLQARRAQDLLVLHDALHGAALRGLRRLILLGDAEHRVAVAVVPLQSGDFADTRAIQLSLGRHQVCGELPVQWFARCHALTHAESRVLEALCEGVQPAAIAERHGVHISTIRSQIGSLREKTHADSIGSLVRQVAVLPPLVGTLRHLRGGTSVDHALPMAA